MDIFLFFYLKKEVLKTKSIINSAILKYDYCNFKLDILEYCDQEHLIQREQFYIDLLKPEYNILLLGGSRLGTGTKTKVINIEDSSEKEYFSIREAARKLKTSHVTLLQYNNTNKLFRVDKYVIFSSSSNIMEKNHLMV